MIARLTGSIDAGPRLVRLFRRTAQIMPELGQQHYLPGHGAGFVAVSLGRQRRDVDGIAIVRRDQMDSRIANGMLSAGPQLPCDFLIEERDHFPQARNDVVEVFV